jgi:glycosyltransferase involved in cell wall biosynthesis
VLESHIPDTLRTALTELNGSASGIHVYPHPIPSSARQLESGPLPPSSTPTRIGFLGRVTRGKGIEEFVQLARRFQDRSDVHFEVHGWLPPNAPALDLRGLDVAPSPTPLTYAAYLSALQSLDYVCLPLPGSYYDFAASGTLLDAIAGLTPIIILDTPLARVIFREAGDIGDLCEDAEALARAVEQIADRVDPGRRGRQVECMRMFRDTRHPTRLAGRLASGWLED